MFRPSYLVAGVLVLVAAACNDSVSNFVSSTATVRLVNDTDTPLTLIVGGVPDSANANLVFGASSGCVFVDPAKTPVPPFTISNAMTGRTITFTPTLTGGANVTIIAFGDSAGNVAFALLNNQFVPATNETGLRFFNGVLRAGSLFMQRNGIAITGPTAVGSASSFVSVPIDSASITFTNGSAVVLDAGLMAFPLGQNSTVVVGPPAQGTTIPLRFFTAQGC